MPIDQQYLDNVYKNDNPTNLSKDQLREILEYTNNLQPPTYANNNVPNQNYTSNNLNDAAANVTREIDLQKKADDLYKAQHPDALQRKLNQYNSLESQGSLKNFGYGLLDSVENAGLSIGNLFPWNHYNAVQRGAGGSYSVGNFLGNIIPMLTAGGLAKKGIELTAKEGIPAISKGAEYILKNKVPSALSNAAGSAIYGGATQSLGDPEDPSNTKYKSGIERRLHDAEMWGLGSLAIDSALPAYKLLDEKFNAGTKAKNLLKTLAGTTLEGTQNTLGSLPISFIKFIRDVHDTNNAKASVSYDDLFDRFKNRFPNDRINTDAFKSSNDIAQNSSKAGQENNSNFLLDRLIGVLSGKIGEGKDNIMTELGLRSDDFRKAYKDFRADKSFENAHWLSSQLGKEAATLRAIGDPGNKYKIKTIEEAKGRLQQDIESFFKNDSRKTPYKEEYNEIKDYFRDNVAPFYHKKLSKYTFGIKQNERPEILANAFSAPDNKMLNAIHAMASYSKLDSAIPYSKEIMSPLRNILFMKLGMKPEEADAEQLISKYNNLEKQGFSHYYLNDRNVNNEFGKIIKTQNNKDLGSRLATGALAASLLGGIGANPTLTGEISAGLGGLFAGPYLRDAVSATGRAFGNVMKPVSERLNKLPTVNAIKELSKLKGTPTSGEVARAAIKALMLPTNKLPLD